MKALIVSLLCILCACRSTTKPSGLRAVRATPTDTLTIGNNTGATKTSVPIGGMAGTIMRHFADGEIPPNMCPQVKVDGTAIPTQADVTQKYPSGSPKQAIIASVLASTSTGNHTVSFQSQPCNNTPLTQAEMLDPAYDFGATMAITYSGGTATADARAMLMAGDCKPWTRGQIAQTMLCAVDTQTMTSNNVAVSKYDIGTDAFKTLRPRFYITFWPTRGHSLSIEYVMESGQSENIQDQSYSLALSYGNSSPMQWYTKPTFTHWGISWWVKRKWVGSAGDPPLDNWVIDHNLAWLESLHVVPPYDLSIVPATGTLNNIYTQWKNSKRDILDGGVWDTSMGQGGGAQPQIGPNPEWYVYWLYTGDPHMMEESMGQADLALAWQSHWREGHTGRVLNTGDTGNTGLGLPVSGYGRQYFTSVNWPSACPNTCGGDKIMQVGNISIAGGSYDKNNQFIGGAGMPWVFDPAHLPAAYMIPYLLTGDYLYWEQQTFWTANAILKQYVYTYGRKASPSILTCNNNLARALAWDMRERANAIQIAPDGDPLKSYFSKSLDDCIAVEEGVREITTSSFNGNPAWSHGRNSVSHFYTSGFPYYKGDFEAWTNGLSGYHPPTLHQMAAGAPYLTECGYQSLNCKAGAGTISVTGGTSVTFSDMNACSSLYVGSLIGPAGGTKSQVTALTCPTAKVQDSIPSGNNQMWETAGDTLFSNGGFMEEYLWGALGRVQEQGFPAGPLYSYASYYYLNLMAGTQGSNPWTAAAGRVPVTTAVTKGGYIQTFAELAGHFKPGMNYSNSVSQGPDGYVAYLRPGVAYATGQPLGDVAMNWYNTNAVPAINWGNPKWAFNIPSGAPPTPTTFTISGTITPTAGGAGATVTLGGASSATAQADSAGAFSFAGLANGNYTVTPSLSGYLYTPSSSTVTINGANQATSFTATPTAAPTYTISGTITPTAGGAGAMVALTGASSATAIANGSGAYSFPMLANGAYTVRPSLTGYTYAPASTNVTVNGSNQTANFTATANQPPPTSKFCDVNKDGLVDGLDAQAQLNFSLGLAAPPSGVSGDRNGDGKVNMADVKLVVDAVAGGMCAATQ